MSELPADSPPLLAQPAEAPAATPGVVKVPESSVFVGPFGLRAGWSLLIFSLLFGLLFSGAFFVFTHATNMGHAAQQKDRAETHAREAPQHASPSRPPEPTVVHAERRIWVEITQVCILLLSAAGMGLLERRRFAVFGLRHFRVAHLLGGAVIGLAALSLLAAAMRALHVLVFDRRLLDGPGAVRSGLLWLVFFFFIGLFEEFFYRGYIQYTLTRGLFGAGHRFAPLHPQRAAFWLAAVLWSLLFLFGHTGNPGENASGLLGVFAAGIVFSYALWRTGSLWWGIGFHMAWDWAESFLFGVPDSGILSAGRLFSTHTAGNPLLSGGSAGPEGSVLVIPTLLLVCVVLRFVQPGLQPPLEPDLLPSQQEPGSLALG